MQISDRDWYFNVLRVKYVQILRLVIMGINVELCVQMYCMQFDRYVAFFSPFCNNEKKSHCYLTTHVCVTGRFTAFDGYNSPVTTTMRNCNSHASFVKSAMTYSPQRLCDFYVTVFYLLLHDQASNLVNFIVYCNLFALKRKIKLL